MLARVRQAVLPVLLMPSALGGAFLGLASFQLAEGNHRLAGILVGWLYGITVGGLMRVLPVPRGWYWLAGFFAGPVPIALLMPGATPAEERGSIAVGAIVGLLLGLLEVAHARRSLAVGTPRAETRPDALDPM